MLNAMPNGNPYAAYKQTAVETATPEKLLVMLFDGGIKFLHQAERALEEKDFAEANKYLIKVQDILAELMVTLDMNQGDVAANLYKLYEFYHHETMMANIKKDAARLQPVVEFFEIFRATWIEAARKARLGAR